MKTIAIATASLFALASCSAYSDASAQGSPGTQAATDRIADGNPFDTEALATFAEPWAMTFLPDGRLLVTEQAGTMKIVEMVGAGDARTAPVSGIPTVDYGGQGGLGDVMPHPDFADNGMLYISYVEAGDGDTRGAVVARGLLSCDAADACDWQNPEIIWRQDKTTGRGHFGHRLAFDDDGYLWITSGERQKFEPAQQLENNMGAMIRLNADGSVPADNPFYSQAGSTAEIWSYGHRNPLGIAIDANGNLWTHEMGPAHGDELNRIERGANYGYPRVSNGDHYDGREIPDHHANDGFNKPEAWWYPAISPAGFVIYQGDRFPGWQNTGLIGGLSSKAIIQVSLDPAGSEELDRYDMGERIRELEEGPDGFVYVLEDGENGRLLRLTPAE
ncbi:MAG: PQQ-dependent sugar dehydrogenase [Pacificimonas sp.]|jgi:glucose/arabinose dehydrogenase|nr:PQQ-dependent sugar dehydrogenase [Pacificimonas sp.]